MHISETIGGLALVFALANSALSVVGYHADITSSADNYGSRFFKERIGPPRIIAIFVV